MKKSTRGALIICYIVATLATAVIAGSAANISCGIGNSCSSVKDYLPGIITACVVLLGGGTYVAFEIKKYKSKK